MKVFWFMTYIFSHYVVKIKVDSYGFLPIGEILTLHNLINNLKSALNKKKITTTRRYL